MARLVNTSSMQLLPACALVLCVLHPGISGASPSPSIGEQVRNTFNDAIIDTFKPQRNETGGITGEMQCYALPYGGIGILSHLLTYWAVAWTGVGRSPLAPWHRLEGGKFDIFLTVVSLLWTIPIGGYSMFRCRQTWPFVLLAVWKLVMSVTINLVVLQQARRIPKADSNDKTNQPDAVLLVDIHSHPPTQNFYPNYYMPHRQQSQYSYIPQAQQDPYYQSYDSYVAQPQRGSSQPELTSYAPPYWIVLYLLGTVVGMVGLITLVIQVFHTNHDIRRLSYGFSVVTVAGAGGTAFMAWKKKGLDRWLSGKRGGRMCFSTFWWTVLYGVVSFTACFGVLSAIYSDLALAAIVENWAGFPSDDNKVLYWAWFAAKRVPLLAY